MKRKYVQGDPVVGISGDEKEEEEEEEEAVAFYDDATSPDAREWSVARILRGNFVYYLFGVLCFSSMLLAFCALVRMMGGKKVVSVSIQCLRQSFNKPYHIKARERLGGEGEGGLQRVILPMYNVSATVMIPCNFIRVAEGYGDVAGGGRAFWTEWTIAAGVLCVNEVFSGKTCSEFVRVNAPELADLYERTRPAERGVVFGLLALYLEGGVYADVRTRPTMEVHKWGSLSDRAGMENKIDAIVPLDPVCESNFQDAFENAPNPERFSPGGGVFAARPGHPIVSMALGLLRTQSTMRPMEALAAAIIRQSGLSRRALCAADSEFVKDSVLYVPSGDGNMYWNSSPAA